MNFIKKYFYHLVIILNLLAILLLFFPCGTYSYLGNEDYKCSGFKMIFGFKENGYTMVAINLLGLGLLTLIIMSLILLIFKPLKNRIYLFLEVLVSLIATFFFLLLPTSVNHQRNEINELFKGTFVIYIGALLLFLIAVICVFNCIKSKKNH